MRILHISATLGCGGIATSLWHLLPALNNQSEIEVAGAVFYENGWFGGLLEKAGIPVIELGMTHKYDPRKFPRLVKLCKQYDIIHAHGWPIILFVALASLLAKKPTFVLTEHSVTNGRRRPYLRWLDRIIYSRFDRIVAVSQAVADSLEKWQPQLSEKISVVYNGINPEYFQVTEPKNAIRERLNLSNEAPVIFASGNFRFAKGFDLLLESMDLLLTLFQAEGLVGDKLPVLVMTGDGLLQESMVELAHQLGIADQIRFLGFRTDMPEILRAADIFVLSSRWEGCPMVVLESMALGVPVLATDVGGVPELVSHDRTGILVPPGDSELLGNALYNLIKKSEEAACLAEQGQLRFTQTFSIETIANNMKGLYRQMVEAD